MLCLVSIYCLHSLGNSIEVEKIENFMGFLKDYRHAFFCDGMWKNAEGNRD